MGLSRTPLRRPVPGSSLTAGLLAAACLVAAASTPAAAAAAAGPAAVDHGAAGPPGSVAPGSVASGRATFVTLITGDRVTILADGGAAIDVADRRPGIRYQIRRQHGHTTVVPSDAKPLLRSGQLDPRLFDVTTLVGAGYADSRRDLGLIVVAQPERGQGPGVGAWRAVADPPEARARSAGATVTRRYRDLGAVAARRPAGAVSRLWAGLTEPAAAGLRLRAGLARIWLDGLRRPALDVSVPQIGAPTAWQSGFTGQGVTVAVLDSGVDATHPDLAGRVVGQANFTEGAEDDRDLVGHGTHVAATIAGTGAGSDGRYRGVAPDAQLLDGKICASWGCEESWILAGMQWAAAERHVKIVNMSIGGPDAPGVDPIEDAVDTLTAACGTLFVIAAGNDGADGTVESPGSADAALTVGAVDSADALAPFSSRGPRAGDEAIKPDVTAPGVAITAARGRDATAVPGQPGDLYTTISGTSMATPHVSGAAALLAQEHPEATPAQLKGILMATASPDPTLTPFEQGAGRIDLARAVPATVTADPPSVSLGRQAWPHTDDPVLTRTVAYRNGGTEPVTLRLEATAVAGDGRPAPAGMFALAPATVTVPAGGGAEATLTVDTTVASATGVAHGRITATGGPAPVTTPFAVDVEGERYPVTLTHLDRAGNPATNYLTVLHEVASGAEVQVGGESTVTVRLPGGRYIVYTYQESLDPDDPQPTLLAAPELAVAGPTALTMDGRLARPLAVRAAGAGDRSDFGLVELTYDASVGGFVFAVHLDDLGAVSTGQVGDATMPGFGAKVFGTWSGPPAGTGSAPTTFYNLAWHTDGGLFTGLDKTLTSGDLARLEVESAERTPGAQLARIPVPHWPDGASGAAIGRRLAVPAHTTEYLNTDDGVEWRTEALEILPDRFSTFIALTYDPRPIRYPPGSTTRVTWNRGVFGPSSQPTVGQVPALARTGNTIAADIGLYSDGDGRRGEASASTQLSLTRDGVPIDPAALPGGGTAFQVPAAGGRYRLSARSLRIAPGEYAAAIDLSTSVSADWTFGSTGAGAGDVTTALPLWSVRFTLGRSNGVPAGRQVELPLLATSQRGSGAGRLRCLSVDVSYDGGASWQAVRVRVGADGAGRATLTAPAGAGHGSLRVHVEDRAGNTADETIVNAFRITTP